MHAAFGQIIKFLIFGGWGEGSNGFFLFIILCFCFLGFFAVIFGEEWRVGGGGVFIYLFIALTWGYCMK